MNKSIVAAVAVSIALIVWMGSGMANGPSVEPHTKATHEDEQLMQVEVTRSNSMSTFKEVTLQGQVEPFRELSVRAEVDGKIEALPIEQGARVEQGTVLLRQALKFRQALRAEAQAQVEHRQSIVSASKKLHHKGMVADSQLAEDKAHLAAAQAQLARIEYEIENVRLTAPFAGVLNERLVELGDYVDQGQKVATLVDDSVLKITAMVPQHQLGSMAVGQDVRAQMINGDVVKGKLNYISTTADAATRSYRIEVLVDNVAGKHWVGMSTTLSVPVAELEGHRISTSAVGLNTAGQLEVKVLGDDDIVKAMVVEIISTEPDSLWVSGLPEKVRLITLGQNFVIDGQQVIGREQAVKS